MAKTKKEAPQIVGQITEMTLGDYAEFAFRRYAIEVIEDRALPDYFDGFKPVHRRVIWAMYMQGVSADKESVKSASVVGETMGKYHPHGDTSIYTAVVTMVNASTPPIFGKSESNFGSMQAKKPAAMRYTNCRLSDYGMTFVDPDYLAVTPMMPNYDIKHLEPVVLPALLPNLFFNGAEGIAVGLTTDIPPMEPVGVLKICQSILAEEEVTPVLAAKTIRLKFPYGGELALYDKEQKADWVNFWKTGYSTLWIGPEYTFDEKKRSVYITGFPPGMALTAMIDKLRDHERVESVDDVTDVSSKQDCVVQVVLKRAKGFETDMYEVMDTIFVKIHPKMNAIGRAHETVAKPEDVKVKLHQTSPLDLLVDWCGLRVGLEIRALKYKIGKQDKLIRRTEMMILGTQHADLVIEVVRSKKPEIMNDMEGALAKKLKISTDDAKMILDLPIRRLSTMDEQKLKKQLKDQQDHLATLKRWLKAPAQHVIDLMEDAINLLSSDE